MTKIGDGKIRVVICWTGLGRLRVYHEKICRKFGISDYMSINKETPCYIREEDMELLEECERRGFIQIRYKYE